MTLETRHIAIEELKATDEGGARTVEGYGSVFGNTDSYGDVVMPGAFVESLKSRKPKMLWQHRSDMPIGVWDEVEERKRGLWMKGRILATQTGNDAYLLLKEGALDGLSIGFNTKKYEIDEKKKVRRLTEVELFETSLVTFPANDRATVTQVKTAHENERDFEQFLREAGYSREAAKVIVAKGFKALSGQREADAAVIAPHAADVDRLAALINRFTA